MNDADDEGEDDDDGTDDFELENMDYTPKMMRVW